MADRTLEPKKGYAQLQSVNYEELYGIEWELKG